MPARIIRPPCTRYQSECRLTVWRIVSGIAWAAASSDMVMVRLHRPTLHQMIPTRESAVSGQSGKTDDDRPQQCEPSNDRAVPDHDSNRDEDLRMQRQVKAKSLSVKIP